MEKRAAAIFTLKMMRISTTMKLIGRDGVSPMTMPSENPAAMARGDMFE